MSEKLQALGKRTQRDPQEDEKPKERVESDKKRKGNHGGGVQISTSNGGGGDKHKIPPSSSSNTPKSASAEEADRLRKNKENAASVIASIGDRPVRVYADGIYDLFHFGHARSLEQAKKLFPNTFLLVGVCNDELTHRLKGKTVMTDHERAESLRHCKWVDEVVEDAPWIVTQDFMDKHQIDFVAHGEDIILDEKGVDIYKFVKDQSRYQTIKRTEGISTSDIILRIVKHYDDYVRRNLQRGYTGKQMNVGFMKEKQIQMEDKLNDIKKKFRNSVNSVNRWSAEHHIGEFMKKFGGEVEKLVSPFKRQRRNSRGEVVSSGEYSSDEEANSSYDSTSDIFNFGVVARV